MKYNVIIPENYQDAVAPAIAGKKLVDLTGRECRDVINSIADLARGSAELFGLVASLNMQYICQNEEFKPATVFEETDIAVGNIYLIHNKLVLIKSVYKNRFIGTLIIKSMDIIVDTKQAMLIGSFTSNNVIPQFEVDSSDCYVLHTPALGVFWGYSSNDMGEDLRVDTITNANTLNEGLAHFIKNSSTSFKLLITDNPDGKDELIEKLKSVIEQEEDSSLKWFDFDEMELFHVQVNMVVKK